MTINSHFRTRNFAFKAILFLAATNPGPLLAADDAPSEFTGVNGRIDVLAISPNGKLLAAAGEDYADGNRQQRVVRIWDLAASNLLHTLPVDSDSITALAFNGGPIELATGDSQGVIRRFSIQKQALLQSSAIGVGPVAAVLYNKEGHLIVANDRIRIWSASDDKVLGEIPLPARKPIGSACQSVDRTLLLACGGREVVLLDPLNLKPFRTLKGFPFDVTSIAVAPDRSRVAVGLDSGMTELWNGFAGLELGMVEGHRGPIVGAAVRSERELITAGSDGTIRFWNLESGKQTRLIAAFHPRTISFAYETIGGRMAATNGKAIKVWSLDPPVKSPEPPQRTVEKIRIPGSRTPLPDPATAKPAGTTPIDALLLNDLKHWNVSYGEWKQEQDRLIGSGNSRIVFSRSLPNDVTVRFKMLVHGDTRPRVRFGSFHFGDEGPGRNLYLRGPKAQGEPFHYPRDEEIQVEIQITGDTATLRVNGNETAVSHPKPVEKRTFTLEGGSRQSEGSTAYYDLEIEVPGSR